MSEPTEKRIVNPSIYAELASRFDVSVNYVQKINHGRRTPVKGKGLKVKEALKRLENEIRK